ncbi:MAG: alpha/beta fold hydrolase, partial [Ktedonobacteraceae bacterium]
PIECALAEIWCDILGVPQASIHDNFFEQGGHSLLAVHLIYQIKKQFNKDLPLSALFRGPTIATLATILGQSSEASTWSPLIQLQHRGSKQPFFCVHPIGGNVLCYADLARHLGSDRPFYGLQAPGLDGEQEPYETIEQMAARYIEAIQTVQASGPYLLGGWSLGGVVAFEMAQQLRTQGHETSLLVLLDSWIALPNAVFKQGEADALAVFSQEITSFLDQNVVDEAFDAMLHQQAHQLTQVVKVHYRALCSYVPKIYPKRILLFTPHNRSLSHDIPGFSANWGTLTSAELEICIVSGDHNSMMTEPFVQTLATRLKSSIDEMESSSKS